MSLQRRESSESGESLESSVPPEASTPSGDCFCKARDKALDLLSRRDHSVEELKRKLRQRGFHEQTVEEAVRDLLSRGYLDDMRFAEGYVRFRQGKLWGRWRYLQELGSRGVSGPTVAGIVDRILLESAEEREEKVNRFVREKQKKGRTAQQIAAALQRRGFGADELRRFRSEELLG